VYVMKAHAARHTTEATEWLSSGMSGVNLLPRARRGQLPLALAERVLDRNGAPSRASGPSTGSTGKSDYCPS
jgi:hypothetical protein